MGYGGAGRESCTNVCSAHRGSAVQGNACPTIDGAVHLRGVGQCSPRSRTPPLTPPERRSARLDKASRKSEACTFMSVPQLGQTQRGRRVSAIGSRTLKHRSHLSRRQTPSMLSSFNAVTTSRTVSPSPQLSSNVRSSVPSTGRTLAPAPRVAKSQTPTTCEVSHTVADGHPTRRTAGNYGDSRRVEHRHAGTSTDGAWSYQRVQS